MATEALKGGKIRINEKLLSLKFGGHKTIFTSFLNTRKQRWISIVSRCKLWLAASEYSEHGGIPRY
jgi:hypothetical protein